MDFEIIRSQRKTVAVEVTKDGRVLVRAPLRLSAGEVSSFVRRNEAWISRRLDRVRALNVEHAPRCFREGETFLFLGEPYRLRFVEGAEHLQRNNGEFLLGRELSARAEGLFRTWYRARAREVIEDRVARFSRQMGLTCRSVRLTDALERWGSCNANGGLNFAWRLVMAPPAVIDYVVVHELTHFVEMNHSQRFWERLRGILPDYAERRKWLRESEHLLIF